MRFRMMPELPVIGDWSGAQVLRIVQSQAFEFRAKFEAIGR